MRKLELVEAIAQSASISKAAAGRALEAMMANITASLAKGGKISLVGFGSFFVSERPERTGRNPRTGSTIKIKATKNPKFRASKALKDAVK